MRMVFGESHISKRKELFFACLSPIYTGLLISSRARAICVEISDDWESGSYKYMSSINELSTLQVSEIIDEPAYIDGKLTYSLIKE